MTFYGKFSIQPAGAGERSSLRSFFNAPPVRVNHSSTSTYCSVRTLKSGAMSDFLFLESPRPCCTRYTTAP